MIPVLTELYDQTWEAYYHLAAELSEQSSGY